MNIIQIEEYQKARDEAIELENIEFSRQENRKRLKRVLECTIGMIDDNAPLVVVKEILAGTAKQIQPNKKNRFTDKLLEELKGFKL